MLPALSATLVRRVGSRVAIGFLTLVALASCPRTSKPPAQLSNDWLILAEWDRRLQDSELADRDQAMVVWNAAVSFELDGAGSQAAVDTAVASLQSTDAAVDARLAELDALPFAAPSDPLLRLAIAIRVRMIAGDGSPGCIDLARRYWPERLLAAVGDHDPLAHVGALIDLSAAITCGTTRDALAIADGLLESLDDAVASDPAASGPMIVASFNALLIAHDLTKHLGPSSIVQWLSEHHDEVVAAFAAAGDSTVLLAGLWLHDRERASLRQVGWLCPSGAGAAASARCLQLEQLLAGLYDRAREGLGVCPLADQLELDGTVRFCAQGLCGVSPSRRSQVRELLRAQMPSGAGFDDAAASCDGGGGPAGGGEVGGGAVSGGACTTELVPTRDISTFTCVQSAQEAAISFVVAGEGCTSSTDMSTTTDHPRNYSPEHYQEVSEQQRLDDAKDDAKKTFKDNADDLAERANAAGYDHQITSADVIDSMEASEADWVLLDDDAADATIGRGTTAKTFQANPSDGSTTYTIYIRKSAVKSYTYGQLVDVVMHEWSHALLDRAGYGWDPYAQHQIILRQWGLPRTHRKGGEDFWLYTLRNHDPFLKKRRGAAKKRGPRYCSDDSPCAEICSPLAAFGAALLACTEGVPGAASPYAGGPTAVDPSPDSVAESEAWDACFPTGLEAAACSAIDCVEGSTPVPIAGSCRCFHGDPGGGLRRPDCGDIDCPDGVAIPGPAGTCLCGGGPAWP